MNNVESINSYLNSSIETKISLKSDPIQIQNIDTLAERIIEAYSNGNKVLLAGNGGSAVDSRHIAAEFASRFLFDRPGLSAIA